MRICDTLLPDLASSFGVPISDTAGTVAMFAIAYGVLQLVYGPLGDRYGKQRVIKWMVAGSAVINLALALTPDLTTLIGLRFVAGAAAAGIVPLSLAYIGDSVPYVHRQHELAKLMSAIIMGMIFGQWSGGILADTLGWRAAFLLLAAMFGAVTLLMMVRGRPASASASKSATTPAPASPSPSAAISTSANEQRSHRQGYFSQLRYILSNAWPRRVLSAALLEGCTAYGALVYVPVHLYQRFDLSLTLAGGIVVFYGLGGFAYTLFARRIIKRLSEQRMAAYGGLSIALGYALLAFATSWPWAIPACAIAGFGFYLLHGTLQTNATQMAPRARGTGMSLFACSLFLGQSIGVSLYAYLLAHYDSAVVFIPSIVLLPLLGLWVGWSIKHRP